MHHPYYFSGSYPESRLRRTRRYSWLRSLVAENQLSVDDLIWPVFVQEGTETSTPVPSMPDVMRHTIDNLVIEVLKAAALGIKAVAIFPAVNPQLKTTLAEEAYNPDNLICRTIRAIKDKVPNMGIIADVALDPYTVHGQDGLLENGYVLNDETIDVLCRQALVQANAGCDIIAPSDMMDGRIGSIRKALDREGFSHVAILSYAAKYASSFYGPFRDAVGSSGALGNADKNTYQMDPANSEEALREVIQDIEEGADMVMVKPGLPYLDIINRIKSLVAIPVLAYQVSGEYAMIKAAAKEGWLNEQKTFYETMLSFKRAGASAIFTYAAIDMAMMLQHK